VGRMVGRSSQGGQALAVVVEQRTNSTTMANFLVML
jgi:hypothetical protein